MTLLFLMVSICLFPRSMSCLLSNTSYGHQRTFEDIEREIARYSDVAEKIIKLAVYGKAQNRSYERLALFVDTVGPRLSGSRNLELAIQYMDKALRNDGFENVHLEPVKIPHWERGEEIAMMIEPYNHTIAMLGLGGSIATPPEGITAEVLVVDSFDDLHKKAHEARGKIVVYNQRYTNYGKTVLYRHHGAVEAAKLGAKASLIKSIAPFSINSPHTGMQAYEPDVPKIPTACIAIEDAELMARLFSRGTKIVVTLKMGAKTYPDADSFNTVAEITGSKRGGAAGRVRRRPLFQRQRLEARVCPIPGREVAQGAAPAWDSSAPLLLPVRRPKARSQRPAATLPPPSVEPPGALLAGVALRPVPRRASGRDRLLEPADSWPRADPPSRPPRGLLSRGLGVRQAGWVCTERRARSGAGAPRARLGSLGREGALQGLCRLEGSPLFPKRGGGLVPAQKPTLRKKSEARALAWRSPEQALSRVVDGAAERDARPFCHARSCSRHGPAGPAPPTHGSPGPLRARLVAGEGRFSPGRPGGRPLGAPLSGGRARGAAPARQEPRPLLTSPAPAR